MARMKIEEVLGKKVEQFRAAEKEVLTLALVSPLPYNPGELTAGYLHDFIYEIETLQIKLNPRSCAI